MTLPSKQRQQPILARAMFPNEAVRAEFLRFLEACGVDVSAPTELPRRQYDDRDNIRLVNDVVKALRVVRTQALPVVVAFSVGQPRQHFTDFFGLLDNYGFEIRRIGVLFEPDWPAFAAAQGMAATCRSLRLGGMLALPLLERFDLEDVVALSRFLGLRPSQALSSIRPRSPSPDATLEIPAIRVERSRKPTAMDPPADEERETLKPPKIAR